MYTFMNVHNLDVNEEKWMCTKSSKGDSALNSANIQYLDVFGERATLVTTSNCVQRQRECATPKTSNNWVLLANVQLLQQ